MSKNCFNKDLFVAGLGCIVGLLGVGYAIGTHSKMSKIGERLELTIDQLSKDVDVDISDTIVNEAVDKAVTNAAKKAVDKATNEAIAELKRDIHTKVALAVEKEYDHISESVLKKTADEVAKIDVTRVRRDIEKAATEAALSKFNDNMDGILDQFKGNLDTLSKVYNSMAGVATRNGGTDSSREYVFRVG